ncbi:MAG: type II toxin-antitoxin system VapC family toxin [Gemmatimonadales bacterium]
MIFVDSNIPMYLVGSSAVHQATARELIERAIAQRERLVTSVEVLQEILHRYTAIRRRDAIQPAFDAILGIADEVFPVGIDDMERAKTVVMSREGVSARDALHVAVMEGRGVSDIMSFDRHFDVVPGITRIGP